MSAETSEWLNTMVLIGHTAEDSPHARVPGSEFAAWHKEYGSDNHYPYSVPVTEIEQRLLTFDLVDVPLMFDATVLTEAGVTTYQVNDPTRKVIVRSDTGNVLHVAGSDYSTPNYRKDVLGYAEELVSVADGELEIMSAGLLKNGARFWTQFVQPAGIAMSGFPVTPWVTIADSCDGRPWKLFPGATAVVCDNTLDLAIGDAVNIARVRHTVNRRDMMAEAAKIVGMMNSHMMIAASRIDQLMNTPVTDRQWYQFLDTHVGAPVEGSAKSATVNANERDHLTSLYLLDDRCAPWAGTAFGIVQTVNTDARHFRGTTGHGKQIDPHHRHMDSTLAGFYARVDTKTIDEINQVFKATRTKQLTFA